MALPMPLYGCLNGGSRGWFAPRETPGQSSKPGTLMKPNHTPSGTAFRHAT